MSLTDGLSKGMVIRHDGQLYAIADYQLAQTGKMKPTVHIRLRSLRDGHTSERTLDQLGKLEEVDSQVSPMQYLYAAGDDHVFMDTENFEQYTLGPDILHDNLDLMVEEEIYSFLMVENQIVSLQMPDMVVLEVTDTAPVEHAGGHSSVRKDAVLNSGLTVKVPMFIKIGERIRVSTVGCQYQGKEHE